jgi:hypothetical protein
LQQHLQKAFQLAVFIEGDRRQRLVNQIQFAFANKALLNGRPKQHQAGNAQLGQNSVPGFYLGNNFVKTHTVNPYSRTDKKRGFQESVTTLA